MPQFDFLFQPMLIALAASIGLISARLWGGRGGALAAVAFFVLVRGFVSLMVAGVWDESVPHFPLYLAEALLVEGAAALLLKRSPLAFGAVAGLLIGTVGTAAEWGWSYVWMPLPWPAELLPEALLVTVLAGVGGGLLGTFIGGALRAQPEPFPRGARVVFPLAGLLVAGLLAFGLATSPQEGVTAKVALMELPGDGGRSVSAIVTVDPPEAAEDAKWLTTTAWQGGGLVVDRLERVSAGVYRTTEPMPVHGTWKTEFRLHSGRSLLGVPVYLPDDPAIPAKGVPAEASFERPFVRDKDILQREAKDGAAGLSLLGYAIVLAITLSIIALNAWALVRLATVIEDPAPEQRPDAAAPRPRPRAGRLVSTVSERRELRLHGHPVAYHAAGSGPVVLLIHGITSSSRGLAPSDPGARGAPHRHRAGPARPRRLGEAARRLLARRLRERAARPARPARRVH